MVERQLPIQRFSIFPHSLKRVALKGSSSLRFHSSSRVNVLLKDTFPLSNPGAPPSTASSSSGSFPPLLV